MFRANSRFPTLAELDQAIPDHPVYINHRSYHSSVVNSLAIESSQLTFKAAEDAYGGAYLSKANNTSFKAWIVAYADEVLFGAKIPIAGIAGDQQAAMFGQACVRPGMAKNTYGTGSFMLMNTGTEYNPPQSGLFSPVLWTLGEESSYAFEGMADVSGAVVQWLRDELNIIEKTEKVTELATSVDDNGGVYFVPAFVGLGLPHFDSYVRGTIIGITRGTGKAHIARAALESMAYQMRDALKIMERSAGKKLEILRVDGGGAKKDILMQFQADILGIPVERPIITETTCLGAAYLAGLATGCWSSLEEIEKNWQVEKRFEPQLSEEKREELCMLWERAVGRASGWLKFDQ